jgi:hypothetical protein
VPFIIFENISAPSDGIGDISNVVELSITREYSVAMRGSNDETTAVYWPARIDAQEHLQGEHR